MVADRVATTGGNSRGLSPQEVVIGDEDLRLDAPSLAPRAPAAGPCVALRAGQYENRLALYMLPFAATTLAGCVSEDELGLGEVEQAMLCPVPTLVTERSLAVTDPTILAKFSFQRVMTAINTSANGTGTPLQLYKDWMATWGACTDPAVDPNGYKLVCPRVETQFGTFNPFAATGPRFVPVAPGDRFDLAPTNGS